MIPSKNKLSLWRWLSLGICAALLLPVASEGWNTAWAEPSKAPEPRVLRIGTLWNGQEDTYLRQQFTDLYELQHPDIELEIIPAIDMNKARFSGKYPLANSDPLESIRGIMGGDKPVDVIIGDSSLIKNLSDHNLLQPLKPLIDRDQYDLSTLAPTMLTGVRELGRGHLFALAPTFNSSALFYNKGIFDAEGVAYPSDGMTWDQAFALAAKVTKLSRNPENRVYGLSITRYASDPFWDMQSFLAPLQLAMYDNQGKQMKVNTPEWNKVWTTYSSLVKKQTIPGLDTMEYAWAEDAQYNPVDGDLFLSGKTAMVIAEYGYINELTVVRENASAIKDYKPVDWGIVTVPTFTEKPGVAMGTWLGSLMSISTTARNTEDAWDLIKFVNSSEVAKIKAHNRYELTSRTEYITSADPSVNPAPFYTLKPLSPSDPQMDLLLAQKQGIYQINEAGRQLFIEVYQGRRTVANALKAWEKKGNSMLAKLRQDPMATFNLEDGWLKNSAGSN